jgi:hypothetical protein
MSQVETPQPATNGGADHMVEDGDESDTKVRWSSYDGYEVTDCGRALLHRK